MSSLSGSSTLAQVRAAYDDNASYEEDNSVSKCKAFITACRILLHRRPTQGQFEDGLVQFDQRLIQRELEDARAWLRSSETHSKPTGGGLVKHLRFDGWRC